jgi:hypothetical protein
VIRLELTHEEAEVLQHLLQSRVADMRKEISHTATRDFREKLRKEEALLEKVLKEMAAPVLA